MDDALDYFRCLRDRLETDPTFQLETIRFENPADGLAFWLELQRPVDLTRKQRELAAIIRGEK